MRALFTAIAHSTPRSSVRRVFRPDFIGFLRGVRLGVLPVCPGDDDRSKKRLFTSLSRRAVLHSAPDSRPFDVRRSAASHAHKRDNDADKSCDGSLQRRTPLWDWLSGP